jgi:hypothetical protein
MAWNALPAPSTSMRPIGEYKFVREVITRLPRECDRRLLAPKPVRVAA